MPYVDLFSQLRLIGREGTRQNKRARVIYSTRAIRESFISSGSLYRLLIPIQDKSTLGFDCSAYSVGNWSTKFSADSSVRLPHTYLITAPRLLIFLEHQCITLVFKSPNEIPSSLSPTLRCASDHCPPKAPTVGLHSIRKHGSLRRQEATLMNFLNHMNIRVLGEGVDLSKSPAEEQPHICTLPGWMTVQAITLLPTTPRVLTAFELPDLRWLKGFLALHDELIDAWNTLYNFFTIQGLSEFKMFFHMNTSGQQFSIVFKSEPSTKESPLRQASENHSDTVLRNGAIFSEFRKGWVSLKECPVTSFKHNLVLNQQQRMRSCTGSFVWGGPPAVGPSWSHVTSSLRWNVRNLYSKCSQDFGSSKVV